MTSWQLLLTKGIQQINQVHRRKNLRNNDVILDFVCLKINIALHECEFEEEKE